MGFSEINDFAASICGIKPGSQPGLRYPAERMAYPAVRPHSADSYLPEDMILSGIRALGLYGVTLPTYLEAA